MVIRDICLLKPSLKTPLGNGEAFGFEKEVPAPRLIRNAELGRAAVEVGKLLSPFPAKGKNHDICSLRWCKGLRCVQSALGYCSFS